MEWLTELKTKRAWNGLYPVTSDATAADGGGDDQSQILNLF